MANIPNVRAVARDISSSFTVQKTLIVHSKQCIQPGIDYFNHQLGTSLKSPLMAFKASRMINPTIIRNLNPDASSIDLFNSFPFVTAEELMKLKAELPAYLAKVEDLDESVDKLE